MNRKIYAVQRYRPDLEATSKEIRVLAKNFKNSIVYDLHLDGFTRFKLNKKIISHHFIFYPFSFVFLYFLSLSNITHIYTSLCDRPYLPFLYKKNVILTSTNFFSKIRLTNNKKNLLKIKKIVVEAEIQKKELLDLKIPEKKIELIYPPVDLSKFSYRKAKGHFKILNASCPGKMKDLKKRGIFLLFNIDSVLKEASLKLLWRGGEFNLLKKTVKNKQFDNITIENKIYENMNEEYGNVHCTVIPYIKLDENLKLIPNSAIESLAAGKPILVSSQTGIAEIVKKTNCGIIFEPNVDSLLKSIKELKNNYHKYQKNCRRTAEEYFSEKIFVEKYRKIYGEMG